MQSDNENVMESVNVAEGEKLRKDSIIVPEVGMLFKNENDMYNCYKKYAYVVGIPVKNRNSKNRDDGVLRYVTLTCSREGERIGNTIGSLKSQPTIKIGCKARISASSDVFGNWIINAVNLDHNYETNPSKFKLYRCNRNLSAHVKWKLQVNDLVEIPLHMKL